MPDDSSLFSAARPDIVDLQPHKYRGGGTYTASTYFRDEGLLVIPTMGPLDEPPSVVRVHSPYGIRTGRYRAAKQGSPPLMPAQADTESGDRILTSSITIPAPTTDPSGELVFGVECEYSWVQSGNGRGTESTYPLDAHPMMTSVDALGEVGIRPSGDPLADVLEGRWNQAVVDSRVFSTYRLFG